MLQTKFIRSQTNHNDEIRLYTNDRNLIQSIQVKIPSIQLFSHTWRDQPPQSLLFYIGNLDTANDLANQLGLVIAIERLYGIEYQIPDFVDTVRVIAVEWERAISHLYWLSDLLIGCGLNFLANRCYRFRQRLTEVMQKIINRSTRHLHQIFDIGKLGLKVSTEKFEIAGPEIRIILLSITRFIDTLYQDLIIRKFLQRVGPLNSRQAEQTGAVGPIARASGIARDLRVGDPYLNYLDLAVRPVISHLSTLWGIFSVRTEEIKESLRLIAFILDQEHSPSTVIDSQVIDRDSFDFDQYGQMSVRIETPRGAGIYSIDCGPQMIINDYSIITPSMMNIPSLELRLKDIPLIYANRIIQSYDFCFAI